MPATPAFFYFDLGNVLLSFSHDRMCQQMAEVAGVSADLVRHALFETAGSTSSVQWRFERGDLKIHLGVEAEFAAAKKAHPALQVRGLAELLDQLRASAVEVRDGEPLEGYEHAYVDDPFGNRIELIEPH